jgi:heme-degrading monooxygenase HmoA
MSVLITIKFAVSGETMQKVAVDNAALMTTIIDDGRRHGTIHHQFVQDPDGSAVVVDEWPDEDSFHRFFDAQQDIRTIMEQAGVTEPPEVRIYPVLDTPDRF